MSTGKQTILYPYHGARHHSCSEADEHDKAEAAMHEARKALDKNQLLLDTAIDALKMATAEAKAATHHAKILEEEHGPPGAEFGFSCVFQTCFGQSGQQISTNGGNTLDSNHVSMYFQELTIQKLSPEGVPNLGTCSH